MDDNLDFDYNELMMMDYPPAKSLDEVKMYVQEWNRQERWGIYIKDIEFIEDMVIIRYENRFNDVNIGIEAMEELDYNVRSHIEEQFIYERQESDLSSSSEKNKDMNWDSSIEE